MSKVKDEYQLDFDPKEYLREYYSEVADENTALLSFLARAYKEFHPNSLRVLEVGGGPTVYQLISLCIAAKEITFSDYLDSNLVQVRAWVNAVSLAFDWDPFIAFALRAEQPAIPVTPQAIEVRKYLMRQKITRFIHCDIFADRIVNIDEKFDLVSTNFVIESVSTSATQVEEVFRKLRQLLKPKGNLEMTGLLGAHNWHVGNKKFLGVSLTDRQITELFSSNGFEIEQFETIQSQYGKDDVRNQGYDGMFMVKARLKA